MNWYTYAFIILAILSFWLGYRSVQDSRADWPVEDDENDPDGDASLYNRNGGR